MLLSVIIYKHKLTLGQWLGAAVVFAGISVEAWVKRKGKIPTMDLTQSLLTAAILTSHQMSMRSV